jgi:hypothetical protein
MERRSSITSSNADAGIVISAEDIDKDLDADPNHLPCAVQGQCKALPNRDETDLPLPVHWTPTLNDWQQIAISLIDPEKAKKAHSCAIA